MSPETGKESSPETPRFRGFVGERLRSMDDKGRVSPPDWEGESPPVKLVPFTRTGASVGTGHILFVPKSIAHAISPSFLRHPAVKIDHEGRIIIMEDLRTSTGMEPGPKTFVGMGPYCVLIDSEKADDGVIEKLRLDDATLRALTNRRNPNVAAQLQKDMADALRAVLTELTASGAATVDFEIRVVGDGRITGTATVKKAQPEEK